MSWLRNKKLVFIPVYHTVFVARKHVFGFCHQVNFIPAGTATEMRHTIEILHLGSLDVLLSRKRLAKALLRLHGCAGWSAASFYACNKVWFSGVEAHMTDVVIIQWITCI